jgi:hypothetical protein
MPENVSALTVSFEGGLVTDDGHHALLKFSNEGVPLCLAVPEGQLMDLMTVVSKLAGQARGLQNKDPSNIHALPVEWWEVRQQKGVDNLVFSFRLPGGMKLNFQVGNSAGPLIAEAISTALGNAMPVSGGKTH